MAIRPRMTASDCSLDYLIPGYALQRSMGQQLYEYARLELQTGFLGSRAVEPGDARCAI